MTSKIMYCINIHSIELSAPSSATTTTLSSKHPTQIFLDVALETGQITRRIFLGTIDKPVDYVFAQNHTIHTDGPISLELVTSMRDTTTETILSGSPFIGDRHLGRHTIFDLEHLARTKHKRYFTFAHRNTPVYKLLYSVERVRYRYTFTLRSITCLKQRRWTSPDSVYAETEYNYNANNVLVQPTNLYWLGNFQQHESSSAFCSHHCSFSSLSPFRIKLFTRNFLVLKTNMDDWIFNIVKTETANGSGSEEYIEWSYFGGKAKEILKFNTKVVSRTITLTTEQRSYSVQFSIKREQLSQRVESKNVRTMDLEKSIVEKFAILDSPYLEQEDEEEAKEDDTFTSEFLQKKVDEKGQSIEATASEIKLDTSLDQDNINALILPINSSTFSSISTDNELEILIDGLQTFGRYYHYMMQAKESIDIVGWELSLSFGLVYMQNSDKWITLEDVLLSKALSGVRIRVMVWRHHIISYLNRYLYLGEVTIEREVQKLQKKAQQMGLKVKVFHTEFNLPDSESKYADPFAKWKDANIVFVIVGNPKGMVSCHHEKMVLIDAELPKRCVAFIGGFDIARGRFDQPFHFPPAPFSFASILNPSHLSEELDEEEEEFMQKNNAKPEPAKIKDATGATSPSSKPSKQQQAVVPATAPKEEAKAKKKVKRYADSAVQPFLPNIRFLWHDQQAMIRGRGTRVLHLHYVQRWVHAFTSDNHAVRKLQLPDFEGGEPMKDPTDARIHNCTVRVLRSWPGVLDSNIVLDNFCTLIKNAQEFIYMEHQYPFQNVALTQCLVETLKTNRNLKLIVLTPVKTDLPSGIVGDLLDMSQDHIVEHLQLIYKTAPDRVGVYGLVRQEKRSKLLKAIYVHSKFGIVDNKVLSIGSANLDNVSFYKSSECQMNVYNEALCKETLERLVHEHLGFYAPQMNTNFQMIFDAFRRAADLNYESLSKSGILPYRLFSLVPKERYDYIANAVNYPNPFSKLMFKLGIDPHDAASKLVKNMEESVKPDEKTFFIQSML